MNKVQTVWIRYRGKQSMVAVYETFDLYDLSSTREAMNRIFESRPDAVEARVIDDLTNATTYYYPGQVL
jgi:hypothetical protein